MIFSLNTSYFRETPLGFHGTKKRHVSSLLPAEFHRNAMNNEGTAALKELKGRLLEWKERGRINIGIGTSYVIRHLYYRAAAFRFPKNTHQINRKLRSGQQTQMTNLYPRWKGNYAEQHKCEEKGHEH